ncbi:Mu transposase C-terminal domain-containing protein [Amantichitinum ursilacus]|uniref:Transposon Tn7 transposition protein TnsB n=1 Tax=Amantichitinum ursilacus TaxID=857265 RepID=A0A0N0GN15_9NEIS|nr:Mu transposase C-terminal domain-containing protein [Amantichitinum ursilacus]KPC52281.1 Transposon Tn7 transposition protein TnsB [Amantichitinum ursilacus]
MNSLFVGIRVTIGGHSYRVLEADPDRPVLLYGDRSNLSRKLSWQAVEAMLATGDIKLDPIQDILRRDDGLPPIPSLLAPDGQAELKRRLAYVRAVIAQTSEWSREAAVRPIVSAVARNIGDAKPPSNITIWRWCKRYQDNGQDAMVLTPRTANCGRRKGQVDPEVLAIFDDVADEFYLTRRRMKRIDLHAILTDRLIDATAKGKRFRIPTYQSMCKWLKARIDPYIALIRREGRSFADNHFRRRGMGPSAQFALERVEFDHTVLDILVVNPETGELLGRPTCTAAICRRTRMIFGIYVSLDPPATLGVVQCLKQGAHSKAAILAEIGHSNLTWPVEGLPRLVVVDNGPEFHGFSVKAAASAFGMDIQYCPPGSPEYKGCIERFLGSLATGLIHGLPGNTQSNPKARARYPSEKLAMLSLSEVQKLVWKWVVVEYHNRRHRELGQTPLECWEELVREMPVPSLQPGLELELATGIVFKVLVRGGKVRKKNAAYSHPRLIHIEQRWKDEVTLRINPDDMTEAYVYDPTEKILLKADCINPDVEPGLSWSDFIKRNKDRRTKWSSSVESEVLRKAKLGLILELDYLHKTAEKKATYKKTPKRNSNLKEDIAIEGLERRADESCASDMSADETLWGTGTF